MVNILKSLMNIIFKTNNKLKSECKMENMETVIETKKDFRFKIDRKKWKSAIDMLHADREGERSKLEKKFWSSLDYYYNSRLTRLYNIRAQSRGRIHRAFAKITWSEWRNLPSGKAKPIDSKIFVDNNGTIKVSLTLEDQAAHVGDAWKEYEKTE